MSISPTNPGPILLFGSGETSPTGQRIFDRLFQHLPKNPRVSLLETPAGFELNSAQVVGRVANFFYYHLQNYHPQIDIIPARKLDTPFSPDNEQIAAPILQSDLIFAGPGSPSYTIRQLKGTLTWHNLLARHRLGAALAFSSSAVIALSSQSLPVYEIYKVGEDLHWKPGLNFFAPYGIPLVFVPHWNNNDGGEELDTSRCFMGRARFEPMLELLTGDQIIIGIDEHTALWLDCDDQCCEVMGLGTVTILKNGAQSIVPSGEIFSFNDLMVCQIPDPREGIPPEIWDAAQKATRARLEYDSVPPHNVLDLVEKRQAARDRRDWSAADEFRDQIGALGWIVKDTLDGPVISKQ